MRILLIRPRPEGERTAAALRALGHDVLLTPLMQVKPVAADLESADWAAVVVTSANALHALPPRQLRLLAALPLFAVGERSAQAAREAGFHEVRCAQGDARDLVRLVVERFSGQAAPHLYLAGEDRAADIEGELRQHGVATKTVVVYRIVTIGFPPELIAALEAGGIEAVAHFSRQSAVNYIGSAKAAGLSARALAPRQLCLSQQVAAALRDAGAADIAVASRPDEAALLALVRPPAG